MRCWDYPYDPVVIACTQCGRNGRYSTQRFLEIVGPSTPFPAARFIIAKDCPHAPQFAGNIASQCEVTYPELAQKTAMDNSSA